MIITQMDEQWLRSKYPDLSFEANGINGLVNFKATYNADLNKFLLLEDGVVDDIGGTSLEVSYVISLTNRADHQKTFSHLPCLKIDGINIDPDRHLNALDGSACLCSPFEEEKFLTPTFQFQMFWSELVIPFLYGQAYYSKEQNWPWPDLSHGSVGLLESYFKLANNKNAEECVKKLAADPIFNSIVRPLLLQKTDIKGHTPCVCPKRDHMRRCHPEAWKGLNMLRRDIKAIALSRKQQV